jgi:hypothetical protein
MTSKTIKISGVLASGEREIRVGQHIAYGTVDANGDSYAVIHGPTQADVAAVSAALDAAAPLTIAAAIYGDRSKAITLGVELLMECGMDAGDAAALTIDGLLSALRDLPSGAANQHEVCDLLSAIENEKD